MANTRSIEPLLPLRRESRRQEGAVFMFGVRSRVVTVVTVVAIAVLAGPGTAFAAGWEWPVSGPVALGYGDAWTDESGKACTHGGVDIAAAPGARVSACTGGRVVFAGRVPAAGGGSTLAVSIVASGGLKYTCMPLSELLVAAGADVATGDALGLLAAGGDGSSGPVHLHLAVRRGEAPLDPLSLLETLTRPVSLAPATPTTPEVSPPPASGTSVPRSVPDAAVSGAVGAGLARELSGAGGQAAAPAPSSASLAAAPEMRSALAHSVPPAPAGFSRRVRPLPADVSLDPGAVSAAVRSWALEGGGFALKGLLLALALLLMAPVLRRLRRTAAQFAGPQAIPDVVRAPRSARRAAR
jgi:hypothetical protein